VTISILEKKKRNTRKIRNTARAKNIKNMITAAAIDTTTTAPLVTHPKTNADPNVEESIRSENETGVLTINIPMMIVLGLTNLPIEKRNDLLLAVMRKRVEERKPLLRRIIS